MNSNRPPYCPICYTQMRRVLDPYTDRTFLNCYAGDFKGDGKDEVVVYSSVDWSIPYLGLLASSGWGFSLVQRYDSTLPAWQMTPGNQHSIGDFNGDGKAELFVYNY